MADKVEMTLRFPETARDASVLLLDQIMTAINRGQLVVSDPKLQSRLDNWKARAALTLSDAMTETRP